jgi:GGDEF domain-containing protein
MNQPQVIDPDQLPQGTPDDLTANSDRFLTLLAEGAAQNALVIEEPIYNDFRASLSAIARQVRDRLPDADKLALIQAMLREFESYRKKAHTALRDRQNEWHSLASLLVRDLLDAFGIQENSPVATAFAQQVGGLATAADIARFRIALAEFLNKGGMNGQPLKTASLKVTNLSMQNDNAAGLPGGGAGIEHVKAILQRGEAGFVVLFRLSCLDVIGERFGIEVVQDSLMAVAAFLIRSLRNDDMVYHWSNSALLAVLETPTTKQTLTLAMQRIVNSNRDITVPLKDRTVMLRIPLSFEIVPLAELRNADELRRRFR